MSRRRAILGLQELDTYAYIYNLGDENIPFTGGVRVFVENGIATKHETYIDLYWGGGYSGTYAGCETVNMIDLTPYNTITVTLNAINYNSSYVNALYVSTSVGIKGRGVGVVKSVSAKSAGVQTLTLDISDLTGSYYIGYFVDYINRVYLQNISVYV